MFPTSTRTLFYSLIACLSCSQGLATAFNLDQTTFSITLSVQATHDYHIQASSENNGRFIHTERNAAPGTEISYQLQCEDTETSLGTLQAQPGPLQLEENPTIWTTSNRTAPLSSSSENSEVETLTFICQLLPNTRIEHNFHGYYTDQITFELIDEGPGDPEPLAEDLNDDDLLAPEGADMEISDDFSEDLGSDDPLESDFP